MGGLVKGAGQILTGNPIKGLGTMAKGVAQGVGHVVKGGLGAVKEVIGDPIVGVVGGAALGFALGGPIGAVAGGLLGPAVGQAGANVFGALETGVGNLFGINGPGQGVGAQENSYAFGPFNGHGSFYPGGGFYPPPTPWGYNMPPGMYGMGPGMMSPGMMGPGMMDPMTMYMLYTAMMMRLGGSYPPPMGASCRCCCRFSC
ncbi:MAG: hypothetical protein AB1758_23835 [Candidatus Eremiobacterota bacterium]